MPQRQLPIFPVGTTLITSEIGVDCSDGKVIYVNGHLPVFQHAEKDLASFRLFTSQLVDNGTASQADIVRAFHVPSVTVKRYVKQFRESGAHSFFGAPRRRSATVLTEEVKQKAQALLEEGQSVPAVAKALAVLPNTLHKAIRAQRLRPAKKKRA